MPNWFPLAYQVAAKAGYGVDVNVNFQGVFSAVTHPGVGMELMLDAAENLMHRPDTLGDAVGMLPNGEPAEQPRLMQAAWEYFGSKGARHELVITRRAESVRIKAAEAFSLLAKPNSVAYKDFSERARCDHSQDCRWALSVGAQLGSLSYAHMEMLYTFMHGMSNHWRDGTKRERALRFAKAAQQRMDKPQELGGRSVSLLLGEKAYVRANTYLRHLADHCEDMEIEIRARKGTLDSLEQIISDPQAVRFGAA